VAWASTAVERDAGAMGGGAAGTGGAVAGATAGDAAVGSEATGPPAERGGLGNAADDSALVEISGRPGSRFATAGR